jgi:hypothetical protein
MKSFDTKGVLPFLIVLALTLAAGEAVAQPEALGEGYNYTSPEDKSHVKIPGIDKNGDGCLDKTEVTPGGQLDKRFSTRDANGDGKLCKDEYYTPS